MLSAHSTLIFDALVCLRNEKVILTCSIVYLLNKSDATVF
jgi:hypothetical protein